MGGNRSAGVKKPWGKTRRENQSLRFENLYLRNVQAENVQWRRYVKELERLGLPQDDETATLLKWVLDRIDIKRPVPDGS